MVLFNHQAERSSFVIASAGVAICVNPPQGRRRLARTILAVSALVGLKKSFARRLARDANGALPAGASAYRAVAVPQPPERNGAQAVGSTVWPHWRAELATMKGWYGSDG